MCAVGDPGHKRVMANISRTSDEVINITISNSELKNVNNIICLSIGDKDGNLTFINRINIESYDKEKEDKLVPSQKQDNTMKQKKAFVEFNHFDREITICAVGYNDVVYVALAIQNPEDKPNKELGRKIAMGRAFCGKPLDILDMEDRYCYDYGILKSICYLWKSKFIKHSTLDENTKRINYDEIRCF